MSRKVDVKCNRRPKAASSKGDDLHCVSTRGSLYEGREYLATGIPPNPKPGASTERLRVVGQNLAFMSSEVLTGPYQGDIRILHWTTPFIIKSRRNGDGFTLSHENNKDFLRIELLDGTMPPDPTIRFAYRIVYGYIDRREATEFMDDKADYMEGVEDLTALLLVGCGAMMAMADIKDVLVNQSLSAEEIIKKVLVIE